MQLRDRGREPPRFDVRSSISAAESVRVFCVPHCCFVKRRGGKCSDIPAAVVM